MLLLRQQFHPIPFAIWRGCCSSGFGCDGFCAGSFAGCQILAKDKKMKIRELLLSDFLLWTYFL